MDLKEAVKKYRSSITALQDRTKRKIPVLRAAVEEVHEVTRDLRERVEVVRNTIQNTIKNHIRELEEQERELIDELENISNSKEKVDMIESYKVYHWENLVIVLKINGSEGRRRFRYVTFNSGYFFLI